MLGSLFCLFISSAALALSEIEISGEMDVTASVWTLPTGERGNSAFGIPSLFLDLSVPLKQDDLLFVSLEGAEQTDKLTDRFEVGVREAYVDLVSPFQAIRALRFGLIPQTWIEAQYEDYGYRYLGRTAWVMVEKWNYQSFSDLGMAYMSQLPHDFGEWAVTLSNGEGGRHAENGSHKEMSLFVRLFKWSPWGLSLNYVRGNYDVYGEDVGVKERIQAQVSYGSEDNWRVALEYLGTTDPADAISDFEMAEGVDVTALAGKAVRGQGGSLYAVFKTGPDAELMVRYDYLNPAVGEDDKSLQTALLALSYKVTEDIRAAVAVDHTTYGEEFAPGVRDRSKFELAAQVVF